MTYMFSFSNYLECPSDLFKNNLKINLVIEKSAYKPGVNHYRLKKILNIKQRILLSNLELIRFVFSNENKETIAKALRNPREYIYENNIPLYYSTRSEGAPYSLFSQKFTNNDNKLRASKTVAIASSTVFSDPGASALVSKDELESRYNFESFKRFIKRERLCLEKKPINLTSTSQS